MRKKFFKSTTFWATAWAVSFLTYALIKQINLPWVTSVAPILASAIVVYVGGNKAVDFRHGPEQERPNNDPHSSEAP